MSQEPVEQIRRFGASLAWKPADFGRVELAGVIDPRSINNGDETSSTGAALEFNTDITALLDRGGYFAAETQLRRHSDLGPGGAQFGNAVMLLAMANYAFNESVSVTGMVDFVDRGLNLDQNEVYEYAIAVLTRPHQQVRLNAEIFIWDETADQADAYGSSVVLNVAIP